jgi:hypothetical protein
LHRYSKRSGNVSCIGRRKIIQIHAARAFIVEQRVRPAMRFDFLQPLDLSRRERGGLVAMRTLSARRIEGGQPPQMHRSRNRMLLSGTIILTGLQT